MNENEKSKKKSTKYIVFFGIEGSIEKVELECGNEKAGRREEGDDFIFYAGDSTFSVPKTRYLGAMQTVVKD